MTQEPRIAFLFKTTFIPTGAYYYGVHESTDMTFGTNEYKDPYIGNGNKLITIAKAHGNQRRMFNVNVVRIGTRKECEEQLKRLLDSLDYSNPLVLNDTEGWPKGRIPTRQHKQNQSQSLSVALVGNENAKGNLGPHVDIDSPVGTKLKWFNNGTDQKMILCDEKDIPIKDIYKEWKLGKLHKNPYVNKRLEEVVTEERKDGQDGSNATNDVRS